MTSTKKIIFISSLMLMLVGITIIFKMVSDYVSGVFSVIFYCIYGVLIGAVVSLIRKIVEQ